MSRDEPERERASQRGRASLVGRFAAVTFLVVASLTVANLAFLGWVFRAELNRSLESSVRSAVTGFQATLERHAAVLDAGTSALTNLPLLKAAMGSALVDAESLQAIVDEQREALDLDLLVLLDADGAMRVASPPIASLPEAREPSSAQLHLVAGTLYLTSVRAVEVDARRIGLALAGKRLDASVLERAKENLGVDVVLAVDGRPVVSTLAPELLRAVGARALESPGLHLELGGREFITQELSLYGSVSGLVLASTESATRRLRWTLLLLGCGGAALAFAIGAAGMVVVRRELRPLQALTEAATRVVEDDDFRLRLETGGTGEIRELEHAFQQMMAKLASVLRQLKSAGTQIGGFVEQMRDSSQLQEEGAHRQASALHQTSSTTEELARSAGLIARSAKEVSAIAARTLDAADTGKQTSSTLHESVQQALSEQRAAAEASVALLGNITKIGRVVEFIGAIADRADLLALNAALEGTNAGPAGAGFTLVAGEMRRLAENVSQSTREIEKQMESIREETERLVKTGQGAQLASERWGSLASEAFAQLEQIVAQASQTRTAVDGISMSVDQQQRGTTELATTMSAVSQETEKGLAATRLVSGAGEQLAALAAELRGVVDRFKIP